MEIRGSFKNNFFYRYVMYKIMKIQYMFPENCWKIILYFVFEKLTSVIFIYILISVEKYCICMILQNSSQTNCILIYLTTWPLETTGIYPVPKEIDFSRYNIICSGENLKLRGIFHVVSCFHLLFMLCRGNLDCFSNSDMSYCNWNSGKRQ